MRTIRIIALALALFVGGVSAVEAQDVALITVSRKQVQGIDSYTTALPLTLADMPAGDEALWIAADIAPADRIDPTKTFFFQTYTSVDGGQTWQPNQGGGFRGDPSFTASTPIGITIEHADLVKLIGRRIRIDTDVQIRMSIGFTATLTRTPPQ